MPDMDAVIYDIERCVCHVPDACRDCSRYGHIEAIGCMEELLTDALSLLKERPEIVRCKDCKHQNWVNAETGCIVCKFGRGTNAPDWFCADGVARET